MNIKYYWFCFKRSDLPRDLDCPTCRKGFLNLHEGDFIENETVISKELSRESSMEHNFHEDWKIVSFSAKLTCSNDRCNEVVLMVGEGQTDWDRGHDELGGNDFEEFYRPRYFEPHLEPIFIPVKCPNNVRNALYQAFKVMFISFGLACNQLRVATEYIVDNLLDCDEEMPKRKDEKFVNLGERISKINNELESTKKFLSAIKIVGNTGSHEVDALTLRDFIDTLRLIERVLNDLYSDGGSESLEDVASHINENKKPRSRIKEA